MGNQVKNKFIMQFLVFLKYREFYIGCIKIVMNGINCTILAYGQTGSGKTHTMFGVNWETEMLLKKLETGNPLKAEERHGIIPRIIYNLFDTESYDSKVCKVACSFVQIYNEKLYDLLEDQKSKKPLNAREDKLGRIYIQGLSEHLVKNMEECLSLLYFGERNRITRQTHMNIFSSRSHSVFHINIEKVNSETKQIVKSKLNLCDLAGSEKIDPESLTQGKHLDELKTINLSLTTLGKVISGLAQKSSHIPYRDSKLTRILQDSIGGSTKTYIIATINPLADCVEETISTLNFASRAQKIMVIEKQNTIYQSEDKLVKKLSQELQYMKDLLQLKRKGGASDLSRQIIILKNENDALRAVTEKTDLKNIEELKKENFLLKQQLGIVRDTTSTLNDSENHNNSKPLITEEKQDFSFGIPNINEQNNLKLPYIKNDNTLSQNTLYSSPNQLKNQNSEENANRTENIRCPVCTLPLPCKHFNNSDQIPSMGLRNLMSKNLADYNDNTRTFSSRPHFNNRILYAPPNKNLNKSIEAENSLQSQRTLNTISHIVSENGFMKPILIRKEPKTGRMTEMRKSLQRLRFLHELDQRKQEEIQSELKNLEIRKKQISLKKNLDTKKFRLTEVSCVSERLLKPLGAFKIRVFFN